MAKVSFNKLGLKMNQEIKNIEFNGQEIEIKQYLPIQDKLGLISRVIMIAHEEDNNYANPVKTKVFTDLEIIFTYTNINFTEKQREDLAKLYDLLYSSGALQKFLNTIPDLEKEIIYNGVNETSNAIYTYQNSIFGILEGIKGMADENTNNIVTDLKDIQKAAETISEIPMLKDLIMPLLLGQQENIDN